MQIQLHSRKTWSSTQINHGNYLLLLHWFKWHQTFLFWVEVFLKRWRQDLEEPDTVSIEVKSSFFHFRSLNPHWRRCHTFMFYTSLHKLYQRYSAVNEIPFRVNNLLTTTPTIRIPLTSLTKITKNETITAHVFPCFSLLTIWVKD